MLKQLINTHLERKITNKNDVALLFSGGLDSLSVLLSCLDIGIKPYLYTFRLDNYVSEDILSSRRIASIYSLELTEVVLDTTKIDLISDIRYMIREFNIKKKTQIQCIQPFLYILPEIKEEFVLTGLCADDLYGTPRSMAKFSKDTEYFYKIRKDKFESLESSSYIFIKKLCDRYSKALIAPYKESQNIADFMLSKTYNELHSPKQKYIMYSDYKEEIDKYNLYRRNSNLQCNSKIREWHNSLLFDKELNSNGFKSVVGIYNKIYKRIKGEFNDGKE